jgi:hypothetical protein
LLSASPYTPDLPGIEDLSGKKCLPSELGPALVAELSRHTGWQFVEDHWSSAERDFLEALVERKYASDSWNRKR